MKDDAITRFVENLATQNEKSAETVDFYLRDFQNFVEDQYKTTAADLIKRIKEGAATEDPKEEQPYRVLQTYAQWLKKRRIDTGENSARTARFKVSWARTLLETNFIAISKALFKQLVKMPKPEDPDLSPVDKKIVVDVISALPDIRLQSYSMFLASMGWRATETLSLRLSNFEGLNIQTLKFEKHPAFVNASGRYSKTKKGKRRQLTGEMARQIERLLADKYKTRTISRQGPDGKWTKTTVTPTPKAEDLVFAPYHTEEELERLKKTTEPVLDYLYMATGQRFRETIDRLGFGYEENGSRRRFTLHTFRRFCFTTCSRTLSESYAKYHIGRRVHEYDKRTPEQIAADFATVEPFLTFLDSSGVEVQQATILKQLEEEREARKRLEAKVALLESGKG